MLIPINPRKDLWPFVRWMELSFFGCSGGVPDETLLSLRDAEKWNGNLWILRVSAVGPLQSIPDSKFLWGVHCGRPGFFIKVREGWINYEIHRLTTTSDVVLNKEDVSLFIDPYFNRMIYSERTHRSRKILAQ